MKNSMITYDGFYCFITNIFLTDSIKNNKFLIPNYPRDPRGSVGTVYLPNFTSFARDSKWGCGLYMTSLSVGRKTQPTIKRFLYSQSVGCWSNNNTAEDTSPPTFIANVTSSLKFQLPQCHTTLKQVHLHYMLFVYLTTHIRRCHTVYYE